MILHTILAHALVAGSGAAASQLPSLADIAADVDAQRTQLGYLQVVVVSDSIAPTPHSETQRNEQRLALHGGQCLWELRVWFDGTWQNPASVPSTVYIAAEDGGMIAAGDGARSICSAERSAVGGSPIAARSSFLSLIRWAPPIGDLVEPGTGDLSVMLRSGRASVRPELELIDGRPQAVVDVRQGVDVDSGLHMTLWLSVEEGWLPRKQHLFTPNGSMAAEIKVVETVAAAPGVWLPSKAIWSTAELPELNHAAASSQIEVSFEVPGWPFGLASDNNANFTDVCLAAGPEPVFVASAAQATTPEPAVALDPRIDAVPSTVEPARSASIGGVYTVIGLTALGLGLLFAPVRRLRLP